MSDRSMLTVDIIVARAPCKTTLAYLPLNSCAGARLDQVTHKRDRQLSLLHQGGLVQPVQQGE